MEKGPATRRAMQFPPRSKDLWYSGEEASRLFGGKSLASNLAAMIDSRAPGNSLFFRLAGGMIGYRCAPSQGPVNCSSLFISNHHPAFMTVLR
jgi:hypothetical protein